MGIPLILEKIDKSTLTEPKTWFGKMFVESVEQVRGDMDDLVWNLFYDGFTPDRDLLKGILEACATSDGKIDSDCVGEQLHLNGWL